jgi:hypothetical protein
MSVPNLFSALIGPIPLSNLDDNFAAVETDIANAELAIANGTYPLTTPNLGNATATSVFVQSGIIMTGAFTAAGSYSDGLVNDYIHPNGRFNVGTSDGFVWNTGGTSAATLIMALSNTGNLFQYTPTPTTTSAGLTLSAAQVQTGIINTTGTSYTLILPTGTALDTAFPSISTVNIQQVGFDFYVINTASGTITMAVGASGMSAVGTLTVATGVSAHFRLRRTAVNTYILYRLS